MDGSFNSCIPLADLVANLQQQVANFSVTAGNAFGIITVSGQPTVEATIVHDTLTLIAGTNITFTNDAGGKSITIDAGDVMAQDNFKTIKVAGQADVVADVANDTLTLVAAGGLVITTVDVPDTITFDGSAFSQLAWKTITCPAGTNPVADAKDDTLTLTLPTNSPVLITGNATADSVGFDVNVDGTTISKIGGVLSAVGGGGGGSTQTVEGYLDSDLTIDDGSVVINVSRYTGSDPGATVTANNIEDKLNPDNDPTNGAGKFMFIGNEEGAAKASHYNDDWTLDWVQAPVSKPT